MHNAYRGGTPDVWYSGPGGDLWVEYKWATGKKPTSKELSALQKDWLKRRFIEGRTVLVVCGYAGGAAMYAIPDEWETDRPSLLLGGPQAVADEIRDLCT